MKRIVMMLLMGGLALAGHAETISGLCMVSVARTGSRAGNMPKDTADVMLRQSDCDRGERGCSSSEDSNINWSRWSGISPEALAHEGAQLDGDMHGDAGDLRCSGVVHDGVLAGRYQFTPDAAFATKMHAMGFDDITVGKQQSMLMLDISTAWTQQIKDAGVTDLSIGKLIGLRALHVDLDYIHGMTAAGYPELRANKLTEMKAVGVTPEKAKEAKELGFQPSEEDLTQMAIFKIDKPFVERMRARGLKDLTLHKLIQIKIFKLDE